MQLEFPYQIVTFLGNEPAVNEPVYGGENGWYPQLTLKRRFKLNGLSEEVLVESLKQFFSSVGLIITTGTMIKPERMPVRVIEIMNQDELKDLHLRLIDSLGDSIISRYPERDGVNYYPHITAEYNDKFVIPVDEYTNKQLPLTNVWLIKDFDDEDSHAYIKIK